MNCKPGDLAVRVKAFEDSFVKAGALVRCVQLNNFKVELHGSPGSLPVTADNVWDIEWNGRALDERGLQMAIPDEHLRPIRNPGDDAQDETLSWLPLPKRDEVAA